MMPSISNSEFNQTDIDVLLERLQTLRHEISEAKDEVAPLEANLALAYEEFQTMVGRLRRETLRLQYEIENLKSQIEGAPSDLDEADWLLADNEDVFGDYEEVSAATEAIDPDAKEKDILLQHIFLVLDSMVNDEDEALLANLQGLCNNRSTSLVDVLAELPWGTVWTARSTHESLATQYRRLQAWEHSLSDQLAELKRAGETMRKDSRFGLWQQKQKGEHAWQDFLKRASEQQQDFNDQLEAELEELRTEWAKITNTT